MLETFPPPIQDTTCECCLSAPAGAELHFVPFPGAGWAGGCLEKELRCHSPCELDRKGLGHLLFCWDVSASTTANKRRQVSQHSCTVPESHIPESDWSHWATLKKLLQSLRMIPACAGAEWSQPWVRDCEHEKWPSTNTTLSVHICQGKMHKKGFWDLICHELALSCVLKVSAHCMTAGSQAPPGFYYTRSDENQAAG